MALRLESLLLSSLSLGSWKPLTYSRNRSLRARETNHRRAFFSLPFLRLPAVPSVVKWFGNVMRQRSPGALFPFLRSPDHGSYHLTKTLDGRRPTSLEVEMVVGLRPTLDAWRPTTISRMSLPMKTRKKNPETNERKYKIWILHLFLVF